MKRNCTYLSLLFWIILGCAGPDRGPDCDSCEIQGQRVSFCENEDGTYYLASGGETLQYGAEELENAKITFEELKQKSCESGEIPF